MDYHDYVIKNGKFVGKFEEMYKVCENPWSQKEEAIISYSKSDTIHTINRFGLNNVIEVGCGLGFFTNKLTMYCPETNFSGLDVSETAIKKAKASFPNIEFKCGGVVDISRRFDVKMYDGIIFAEILWYILDDLDNVIELLKKCFRGKLIVNQVFYHGTQQYGRDFFTNQEEMIKYFDLPVLVKNFSDDSEHKDSYETHTVFSIE